MALKKFAIAAFVLFAASAASAQNVSGRVSGAVGGVSGTTNATTSNGSSMAPGTASTNPYSALNSTPGGTGGDWSGGLGVKVGDKVLTFRGAVGVDDNRSTFKAGAGIPF